MRLWEKLEGKVSGEKTRSKSRHLVQLSLVLLLAGVTLLVGGVNSLRGKSIISADVANPPVPAEPAVQNPTTTVNSDGSFTFSAGWSLVAGQDLAGKDLSSLKDSNLILYSFNDPAYPTRVWSTSPDDSGATTSIVPQAPFGYYIYNPGTSDAKVAFKSSSAAASDQSIVARGWHLLYWPSDATSYSDLMSKITLTYSDGTKMTAADAVSSEKHRASIKLYLVQNGGSTDASTAIKELNGTNSGSSVSNVPAKGYFWLYLRRTSDRVTNISIAGQGSSATSTPGATATSSSIAYPPVPPSPTATVTITLN